MSWTARSAALFGLLACAALSACDGSAKGGAVLPAPLEGKPNVLLVSIDTLRADHVGAYGAERASTPTLDRIAREEVRFTQALSPAPLTLPSHATLLTALDPPRHGVRHNGIHCLPESVTTLAERFREAGYTTGAVVGAAVLSARYGLAQGFDHYDDAIVPQAGRVGGAAAQRDARAVREAAWSWLARAPEPFFLFVHFYDPHSSYQPPPPFDRMAHPYDGEIAYVDAELGGLLAHLEGSGRLAKTLVAVTADHGESLGEHEEATHAYTVYDATQRVPLLLRGPGVPVARREDTVVRLADVAPTLLARAGVAPLAPSSELDGRDLTPLLRDASAPVDRLAYVESLATQIDQGWAPLHGMRSTDALLIRAPRSELYVLAGDPSQTNNVHDDPRHAALRMELETALDARLEVTASSQTVTLDPSTRAQLGALGYALPDEPGRMPEGPVIDPKDGLVQHRSYHEAELALAAGRLEEAGEALRRLVALHPRSAQAHGKLAVVALRRNDAEEARHHARRAAELQPRSAPYWQQLGVVLRETGQPAEAREVLAYALALDPDDGSGHLEQMQTCAVLVDLACTELEEAAALRLVGSDIVSLRRMADAWETAGESRRALAAYRRVLTAAPDSQRDHMHAAIHAAALGDPEGSAAHLARAGAVREDPRAQRMLAEARASATDAMAKP